MSMRATTQLSVFDTDPALWDALAGMFDVKTGDNHEWISFTSTTGVDLTFFKADAVPLAAVEPEAVAS